MVKVDNKIRDQKIHSMITAALIAFEMARVSGEVSNGELTASAFLSRWLKKALKQKRFDRELAGVLTRFITENSKAGCLQRLKVDFYSIFNDYRTLRLKNKVFETPEITRLHIALELIKGSGIKVQDLLDYDPSKNGPYEPTSDNELFILKKDYESSVVSTDLSHSLSIYVVGQIQPIVDIFYDNGFISEIAKASKSNNYYQFRIHPLNNVSGQIATPSVLK